MKLSEKNINAFNNDVQAFGGYAYTSLDRVSSRLANERISRAIKTLAGGKVKRIIDIGCGDGMYTEILKSMDPVRVVGVDAAQAAVERARLRLVADDRFHFDVRSVYDLQMYYGEFDLAIVRGVLHHLREPEKAVTEIVKTAPITIVVEPNGLNPVLKLLEIFSSYHRQHEERSFWPSTINRWFLAAGAPVRKSLYVNTVPMFCPDPFARLCKLIEPIAEMLPGVRHLGCGQYVFLAQTLATHAVAS